MLGLARETGVRLQFSHLIFVGEATWNTLDEAIARFDKAIADGVDVKFMTDSWPEPSGVENAATFGAFPRFLQIARETGNVSLETLIHRMTAQAAERFGIAGRGSILDGYVADVVVLDWQQVRDNTTRDLCDAPPSGIEHVFINGVPARLDGKKYTSALTGKCLAMSV